MSNGSNQDQTGQGNPTSPAEANDVIDGAGTVAIIGGVGLELMALFAVAGPIAILAGILGGGLIILGVYLEFAFEKKACEAEIIESTCRVGWLQVGKKVCLPCPKSEKCPTEDETFEMFDIDYLEQAKADTPKCEIKVRYKNPKCSGKCDAPMIVFVSEPPGGGANK